MIPASVGVTIPLRIAPKIITGARSAQKPSLKALNRSFLLALGVGGGNATFLEKD